jgi:hypothetical protein
MDSSAFSLAANIVGFVLLLKALLYRIETVVRQQRAEAPSTVSLSLENPEHELCRYAA